ncbi:MAG: ion transporter [Chloroflexota bacterium]|jgi:voltage-gated potassium channel
MTANSDRKELKSLGYEVFIALLSILSIINMFIVYLPGMSEESEDVVTIFQAAITLIFLADFFYRLFTAQSKSNYFFRNWGWADLLACLPFLRILRVFRVFRVYRLLRDIGIKAIRDQLLFDRAGSVLYLTIFMGLLIIQTASILVLNVESMNPEANIQTPADAIWWTYVTITTVGYGDRYPTTNMGRIVGVLLMTSGVALFGVFTSFLANTFLSPRKKPEEELVEPPTEGVAARLLELRQLVEEQEKTTSAIRQRLKDMEKFLDS